MIWQDALISFANAIMSVALVPQILSGFKTKKRTVLPSTSAVTSFGLFLMAISLFTLKLKLSFAITLTCFILWGILFIQSIFYR